MSVVYSDNFDTDTAGSIAPGWVAKVGTWAVGTVSPISGTQSFGSTSHADGDVALYTAASAMADMSVYYDQVLTAGNTEVCAILRMDSAYQNGYLALITTSGGGALALNMFKRVSGSFSSIATSGVVNFTTGAIVGLRAQIQGSTFKAKIWDTRNTEPASWTISVTDTSVTAAGYAGLYNAGSTPIAIDDFSLSTVSTTPVVITPDNAAFVFSPGNWDITSVRALSINAGAYFRTLFADTAPSLTFDVSSLGSPASEIYYRIDGYETQAPWTKANVAATIALTMPSDTSAFPWHLLEVVIKSTSETINRWNTGTGTAVKFTSLTLSAGSTVTTPGVAPGGSILLFGDSITEGVRTVNQTATNDTDRNDAMMGWAYRQRDLLGVEVGVIGFGGSGLTVTGSGNVPVLSTSYSSIMSGITRNTSISNLKLIVLNEGTNDANASSSAVTTAMTTVLNGLLSAYSGIPIAVMRPFNGAQASALQAGIAACSNPSLVHWVDTTGFFNTAYGADSLNLHPSGPNNLALIAPQVAAALKLLVAPTSGGGRSSSYY